jgi:hypothetical protein
LREVSLPEAASILGLTREGVRRRLLKGRLEGRKSNETREWIVYLPDEAVAPTVANGTPSIGKSSQELQVQLARLEERLAALEDLAAERLETIGDLRRDRDRLVVELVEARHELAQQRRPLWERLLEAVRRKS